VSLVLLACASCLAACGKGPPAPPPHSTGPDRSDAGDGDGGMRSNDMTADAGGDDGGGDSDAGGPLDMRTAPDPSCNTLDPEKVYLVGVREPLPNAQYTELHLHEDVAGPGCTALPEAAYLHDGMLNAGGELIYSGSFARSATDDNHFIAKFKPDALRLELGVYKPAPEQGSADDPRIMTGCSDEAEYTDVLAIAPADDRLFALCVDTLLYTAQDGTTLPIPVTHTAMAIGLHGHVLVQGPLGGLVQPDGAVTSIAVPVGPGNYRAARAIPGGFWLATDSALYFVAEDGSTEQLASYPPVARTTAAVAALGVRRGALDSAGRFYQVLGRLDSDDQLAVRRDPDAATATILFDSAQARAARETLDSSERSRTTTRIVGFFTGAVSMNPTGPTP